MRKKSIAFGILAVIFLIVTVFAILFSTGIFQNTALGFNDGFTLIGSNLEVTNVVKDPSYLGRGFPVWNSKYFSSSSDPSITSTDQNYVCSGWCYFNEALGARKLKFDINYLLSSSNTKPAQICMALSNVVGFPSDTLSVSTYNQVYCNPDYFLYGKSAFNGQGIAEDILIEVIPNLFDNNVNVFVNGQQKASFDKQSVKYLFIHTNNVATLKNTRYQPILGCTNDANDAIIERTFTSGQTISLDSFKYPVKQFCYSSPIYVVRQTETGASSGVTYDGSIEVFSKLIQAQSVDVPAGDMWRVTYSIDNSKGLVPSCGSRPVNETNNACVPLVVDLSEGTIDTNTNTFTIEPKVLCEEKFTNADGTPVKGSYNVQTGQCVLPQKILEYCDANTDECQLRIEDTCKSFGFEWVSETQRCESKSMINPDTGKVITKVVYFNLWTYIFLIIAILFGLLSAYFAVRRKR